MICPPAVNSARMKDLRLQSFLYEKNHYQKEIYFCKEYKTPQLDRVLERAKDRDDSEVTLFKNGGLRNKGDVK